MRPARCSSGMRDCRESGSVESWGAWWSRRGWAYSELVDVHNWSPDGGLVLVEVTHSDLSKVSRVVLIDCMGGVSSGGSRVSRGGVFAHSWYGGGAVLQPAQRSTGLAPWFPLSPLPYIPYRTHQSTSSRMLPVLSDTTITCRHMSTVLAGLAESGRHLHQRVSRVSWSSSSASRGAPYLDDFVQIQEQSLRIEILHPLCAQAELNLNCFCFCF